MRVCAHLNNKSAIRVGEFAICAYYIDFGTVIYVQNISEIRVRFFFKSPRLLLTNETTVLRECVSVTIILQCFSFKMTNVISDTNIACDTNVDSIGIGPISSPKIMLQKPG